MSGRPAQLTAEQAAQLGAVVLDLREDGYGWKEIADFLGMSAKHLRRCARRHGMMSQQNPQMSHRGDCAGRDAA
ncbi:MAG TPA: hypothetical protein VF930_05870 [Stellaceae bacterium]